MKNYLSLILITTAISLSFFFSLIINWAKIDNSNPITVTSNEEIYIKEVDSAFVIEHNVRFEPYYNYFLTGRLETRTYRSGFLQTYTEIDTIDLILHKKVIKNKI